ncbi:helix-turn-helix domain-containing protein [Pseudovibrio sp. Tun.PSC04-5.I4]|uniref:winged helix-turn-helix transcriptional regulator n=1 Tax=Pseudovibrio sp. Tun.PSC04-5.I4 TaxID=1798213 RepID=UPI0008807330|nr:helix-turn-helix domain-containing protein [Pseudovibrio sp. Tun.PSC04-5.I4]SDR30837.1 DNA-binding transcriptional regulator, HxlR family [Pseudovibrio sp. Tun.PSC04-5.I4]
MSAQIPKTGKPVRGSKSGKPIMVLFDLLGRRWALGIVWNLSSGPQTFRSLQSNCDSVSPTVLNTRLKELRECGIVTTGENGYELSEQGRELFVYLEPLGAWSQTWSHAATKEPQ